MAEHTIQHPFVVGEQYQNENGVYTVVTIDEPEMEIEYTDGSTLRSSIRLQRRIWERIQHEQEIAEKKSARAQTTRRRRGGRSRASLGRDFHGLQESDFSRDITGTSWRRRTELAGLLALRLSEMSGLVFQSHAVYRRPEVYIVQPEHWNPKQPLRATKFFFNLSEQGASYGFYIEKPDEPMDTSWDWPRFLAALVEDKGLQARALIAMEHSGLTLKAETESQDDSALYSGEAEGETLYVRAGVNGERTSTDWDGFVELLDSIPADQWCNLYLATEMEKAAALEAGVGLASEVAQVYNALLPLYAASARR